MRILLLLSALAVSAAAQEARKPAPTQKEIDDAVRRGLDYLKTAPSPGGHLKTNCDELILLTLIHGGMSEKNEVFQKYLNACVSGPLEHTYKVALLAMCLEELDPALYQPKIAQCAQFLIDNMCKNGQWAYGSPTEAVKGMPSVEPRKAVASEPKKPKGVVDFGAEKKKSKPTTIVIVKKSRDGPEQGDNSNTQYGALGLRACFDAKIKIPEEVIMQARTWWMESQFPPDDGADKNAVSSGGDARPRGWNYTNQARDADRKPYHAMTAGGVGSMAIYDYMIGRDWKKESTTKSGVAWLGAHFAVNTNYYYMYGLERAGMLYGTENFGSHNWYWEGARLLVDKQSADGSWGERKEKDENTWDTCFAILFLKKATKSIATGDGKRR